LRKTHPPLLSQSEKNFELLFRKPARVETEQKNKSSNEGETNMNKRVLIPAVAVVMAALGLSGSVLAAGSPGFVLTTRAGHPSLHDMVVEPGTDPSELQMHFAGAERVTPNASGNLDIIKKDGTVWHYKPQIYQVVNGKRRPVVVSYHVMDKDRVSLKVQKLDPAGSLVVGPVDNFTQVPRS
jgi:hypothetical protein